MKLHFRLMMNMSVVGESFSFPVAPLSSSRRYYTMFLIHHCSESVPHPISQHVNKKCMAFPNSKVFQFSNLNLGVYRLQLLILIDAVSLSPNLGFNIMELRVESGWA
jgi:hypothetical protein